MDSLCQPTRLTVHLPPLHELKLQFPDSTATVRRMVYSLFCEQPMKGRVYKGLG